jgi:hypothetical protein
LIPNKDTQQIDIRFISYSANLYKVHNADGDYQKYERVTYNDSGSGVSEYGDVNYTPQGQVTLEAKEFVYKKFAGRLSKVNDLMPKTAKVLTQCENLDRALCDWRAINKLFASPTPVIEGNADSDVKELTAALTDIKWKIGTLLVLKNATYKLAGIDAAGIDALEKEILALAKVISGATGVPVHFLGYPDLMANKSTSNDLFEFINASCSKERSIWTGFYEELFYKALVMARDNFQTGFNPDDNGVKAQILQVTEAKLQELVTVWLPLLNANAIDLDYMLSKIPDIDPDRVKKTNEESSMKMLESIRQQETTPDVQLDANGNPVGQSG